MPKKHQPHYLANLPKHSTPSTPTTTSNHAQNTPPTRGVNERLEQLRREQAPRPTRENWNDVSTIATAKTIPPHLRHILAIPETAPPRARRGIVSSAQRIAARRTAGPPPPTSWIDASMHAPAGTRARARREMRQRLRDKAVTKAQAEKLRQRPERSSHLTLLSDAPHALPSSRSLKHHALKVLAENWDWLAEYESNNLAALPAYLKTHLLTYLSLYGPDEDISLTSLKALFLTDAEVPGGTGTLEIGQLDFTGLLSHELTLAMLSRYIARKDDKPALDVAVAQLEIGSPEHAGIDNANGEPGSPSRASNRISISSAETLDSWEEAADNLSPPLAAPLTGPRFASLTRLSLAQAGFYASWSHLLTLAPHLHKLTHLSLAHWPTPSVTPNSRTTFVQTQHGSINLGGTHLYSALDDDWYEAANILRRLSKDTFSLEWLDLKGCVDWIPALTWEGSSSSTPDRWAGRQFHRQQPRRQGMPSPATPVAEAAFNAAEEEATTRSAGPDWTTTWSQLAYVDVSQGSLPQNVNQLRSLPAGRVCLDLLLHLRERDVHLDARDSVETDSQTDADGPVTLPPVEDYDLPRWLENEKAARKVAAQVHLKRSAAKGKFCVFDHGWKVPAPVKRGVGLEI